MSIPGAPNPVKWSDIYNAVTGTIHNGSTSIKISDYIGQIWSDNTFVPSKDISIDKHFRGKSMPAGELEIEMPPGGVANNLLETYWPFYGLYNYGQSAFYYSSSLLSLTKLKTNDQITAIEFEIFAPENAEPGNSGYLYPRNQEIWIGQANPDNNIFWYRTQANFEGTRENQPVKFDKPLAQYKNWNFDSTNQPLIPGTQKVKLAEKVGNL